MSKVCLILHDTTCGYFANEIAKTLRENSSSNYTILTFAEILLSGEPLNLKKMVDEAFAVIILDGKFLFSESLTAYSAEYARQGGKAVFVYIADPKSGTFSLLSHNYEILLFDPNPQSLFWTGLKASLALLRSNNLYL